MSLVVTKQTTKQGSLVKPPFKGVYVTTRRV